MTVMRFTSPFDGFRKLGRRGAGTGGAPPTVPATITEEQWTLSTPPSIGGDQLTVNLISAPANGGSAITSYQFRRNGGAASTLANGTALGSRNITVLATTLAGIQVRAINAIGPTDPEAGWSDTKSATPIQDVAAPTISSTAPADNATGVPASISPTITFNEAIVFGTGLITLRENNGGWADLETFDVVTEVGTGNGQVSISGGVLTINPTAALTAGREYAIRIAATAIDDLAGNSFAGVADDTTISFTAASGAAATLSGLAYASDLISVTTNDTSGPIYYLLHNSVTPLGGSAIKTAVLDLSAVGGGTLDPLETDNQPVDWTGVTPGTYWINMVQDTGVFSNVVTLEVTIISASFDPASVPGAEIVVDFTDLTTLWQNTNGTGAVTATGQSIGSVTNRGSLGGLFANTGTGTRPLYTEAGALKYGDFDGVDDFLRLDQGAGPAFNMSGGFNLWIVAFDDASLNSGFRSVAAFTSPGGGSFNNAHHWLLRITEGGTDTVAARIEAGLSGLDGVQGDTFRDQRTTTLPWSYIEFECIPTVTDPNVWMRMEKASDGGTPVQIAQVGTITTTGYPNGATNTKLAILGAEFNAGNANRWAKCRIAAMVLVAGTVSAGDRDAIREWCRTRAGF